MHFTLQIDTLKDNYAALSAYTVILIKLLSLLCNDVTLASLMACGLHMYIRHPIKTPHRCACLIQRLHCDLKIIVFVSKSLSSIKMSDAINVGAYSDPKPATHGTQKIVDKVSIVLRCI